MIGILPNKNHTMLIPSLEIQHIQGLEQALDQQKTNVEKAMGGNVKSMSITGDVQKILTLTLHNGHALQASFEDLKGVEDIADIMLNSLNFNTQTGVLTGVRNDGTPISVSLDGRYALQSHTHSYGDIQGLVDYLDRIIPQEIYQFVQSGGMEQEPRPILYHNFQYGSILRSSEKLYGDNPRVSYPQNGNIVALVGVGQELMVDLDTSKPGFYTYISDVEGSIIISSSSSSYAPQKVLRQGEMAMVTVLSPYRVFIHVLRHEGYDVENTAHNYMY